MVLATNGAEPFPDLYRLLEPKSMAIIGASDRPGNLGGAAVRHLQKFGYPGAIWPVNPRQQTVAGLPCFASPRDLPEPADMALFAVSAESLAQMVRECAEAGILNGVAWAGGFAEVGGEGKELQKKLVDVCRETGFKLCGPNCIGIINGNMPMISSFTSALLEVDSLIPGSISVVSQSGGTGTIAYALAGRAGFGFRYMISSGNEAVLTAADYINALVLDPETRVIAAYLEGVKDGPRLLAALRAAREARKPVVMLKSGATPASARAAASHTGALAGEDRVWDAIFREQAVIRVHSLEEMLDVAMFLSGTDLRNLPRGKGVAAITHGGGSGVLGVDQCDRYGLDVPPLAPETRERLKILLPPIASITNPVDVTPEAFNRPEWFALLPEALEVIAADPGIHSLIFLGGSAANRAKAVTDVICDLRDRIDKPVCVAWPLLSKSVEEALPARGVYSFPEHDRAIRVVSHLVEYARDLSLPLRPEGLESQPFDWTALVPRPEAGMVISEHECHRILAAAGLPVAAGRLATSPEDAVRAANSVRYPVALKGISSAVTHRAAAGMLALDLRSDDEVRDAYLRLLQRAKELQVELDGAYVQHMERGSMEILVSAFRDPQFGAIVSVGAGGNLTELIDDVTLERAPLNEEMAIQMLDRLRIVSYARRKAAPDMSQVAKFIAHFSRLAASAPWRRFVLEVNPIKWNGDGVVAVDGLLVIEEP